MEAMDHVKYHSFELKKKYRSRIVTSTDRSVTIHSLTKDEGDLCLKEIRNILSIFIREGLPAHITKEQIRQHAHSQGIKDSDIIDISVHMDVVGHCAVHAYVTCSSPVAAKRTAAKLNESTIAAGYKLKVYYATDANYDECVPSNWPGSHRHIVVSRLRSMTGKERDSFTYFLPAKISIIKDEIMFVGKLKDTTATQDIVKTKFLNNLQQRIFTYHCLGNSKCKQQIEKFVITPWNSKLQFTYYVKENNEGQLDIAIFSQIPADFCSICNHLQVSFKGLLSICNIFM